MRYLVDTNVLSDARRRRSGPPSAWLGEQRVADLGISVGSLMELDIGIRIKERSDPAQGAALRRWFQEQVLEAFAGRVLPVDERVAIEAAALHVPDPMPDMDSLIAATARVHGLTVATRNVSDFARSQVPVLNPWEPGS